MTHLKCKRRAVQYYKDIPHYLPSSKDAVEKSTAILISDLLYMTFKTSPKGLGPLFLIYWSFTMLSFGVGLFHSLYWHFGGSFNLETHILQFSCIISLIIPSPWLSLFSLSGISINQILDLLVSNSNFLIVSLMIYLHVFLLYFLRDISLSSPFSVSEKKKHNFFCCNIFNFQGLLFSDYSFYSSHSFPIDILFLLFLRI